MRRTLFAAACVVSFVSWAQDADAGVSAEPPAPVAAPAAAVSPTPAPAGPSAMDTVNQILAMFRVYGLLKPTIAVSSGAVESFSNPNMVAMTAAGNPVLSNSPAQARLSFQIQQSRLGVWFGEGTPYRAQVELDFVDFTKASPTVAALPRLRIAKLEWSPIKEFTLVAGQDWGLEQPVNPHGINLVGGAFQAGNTGFMRQQVKVIGKLGDFEVAAAAGLQNNNNTAKDGLVELSLTPTAAARAQWNVGGRGRLGASFIGTSTLLRGGPTPLRTFAGEVGIYGDVNILKDWNVRFEGYWGQNAANLYLLALGQGRAGATVNDGAVNIRELGGFISTRFLLGGPVSMYGTIGGASVLNADDVVPSYNYSGTVDPANPPAFTTAALTGTGPGIRFNLTGRLGVEVKVWKGISFLAEGFWYRTQHSLQAVDRARVNSSVAQAFGAEFGGLWTF